MKEKIVTQWQNGMSFETIIDGTLITMDASPAAGGQGKGPRPKPLMLAALAGCTGIDVVSILAKMKIELEYFRIHVESDVNEEHPKSYKNIMLIYEGKGKDLTEEKFRKAIDLSLDKYCSVSAVYKKAIPVNYKIIID